jgi:hypothetical protein
MSLFLPELERELRAAIRARSSPDAESGPGHDPAHGGRSSRVRSGRRPNIGAVAATVCSVLALAVAGVLLISLGAHESMAPHPPASSQQVPAAVRKLATKLAVLRRPQTAKDRSFRAVVARALGSGGFSQHPIFRAMVQQTIPSLTRYTQTLPDGQEVFLIVFGGIPGPGRTIRPASRNVANIGLALVPPRAHPADGEGLGEGGGGASAASLYFFARRGPTGCDGNTLHNIVPDGIARIRWQFPRQDAYGYVYKGPLTVNVPVRQNVAIATINGRASCDKPSVVTLYDARGQIISKLGNATALDRITRPIRRGPPPGP